MKIFLRLGLLLPVFALAQIPAGYYNSATGTGYALKTQLHNIIKNHTVKSYNSLYQCYQSSDRDYYYENDGTILDMYSEKPGSADAYTYSATNTGDRCGNYSNEGDCFNREHIMPQSVFNEASPMVSDAHHIIPSDGKVNGMRSSFPFGVVNSPTWTSTNGSKLGNNATPGYSNKVFEPIDEFKGDIARCLLYFAVRYQNNMSGYSHAMLNGTSDQVFSGWFLNILLTWHSQDPVSAKEIARNNAIYAYQDNRNPFIDHPEYACMIWANGCALSTQDQLLADLSVYPNPGNDGTVNITTAQQVTRASVYDLNGRMILDVDNPVWSDNTVTLQGIPAGLYILRIEAAGTTALKKLVMQ